MIFIIVSEAMSYISYMPNLSTLDSRTKGTQTFNISEHMIKVYDHPLTQD